MTVERAEYKFPHSGHLSPSQITSYLNCPRCWYLERIQKEVAPMSVALPIGGAVHKAVETYRRRVLTDCSTADSPQARVLWVDAAADHFDRSLEIDPETGGEIVLDIGDYRDIGEAKDHAVALTKFVLPEIAKLDAQRGLVAAELDLKNFESPWPFEVWGRVDALYSADGEHYTAGSDLKTSNRQAPPDFMAALQLGIYRSFLPGDWFADVVAKGSPKTKGGERIGWNSPSFQPYALSDEGDDFVRDIVLNVADRICRGDFPARPGFRCKFSHGNPTFHIGVSWPEAS